MHAQILADRPEAARLLAQALPSLSAQLGALGLDLADLDVALGGDRANQGADGAEDGVGAAGTTGRGDGDGDEGAREVSGPSRSTGAAGSGRLDILA
jgi:hypothetical protein